VIDAEWEAFQRAISSVSKPPPQREPNQTAFARATVAAEPELVQNAQDGFPDSVMDPNAMEGGVNAQAQAEGGGGVASGDPVEDSEEQKARRRVKDERELVMDRLVDEERAQEEADARVSALKARLDLVKKRREQAREAKEKKAAG